MALLLLRARGPLMRHMHHRVVSNFRPVPAVAFRCNFQLGAGSGEEDAAAKRGFATNAVQVGRKENDTSLEVGPEQVLGASGSTHTLYSILTWMP